MDPNNPEMQKILQEVMRQLGDSLAMPYGQLSQALTGAAVRSDELRDAWSTFKWHDVSTVATYEHPNFPEATITVSADQMPSEHPRNPNPAAGRITVWFVKNGDRVLGNKHGYHGLTLAKAKGKALHDMMVAALIEKRKLETPHWGKF